MNLFSNNNPFYNTPVIEEGLIDSLKSIISTVRRSLLSLFKNLKWGEKKTIFIPTQFNETFLFEGGETGGQLAEHATCFYLVQMLQEQGFETLSDLDFYKMKLQSEKNKVKGADNVKKALAGGEAIASSIMKDILAEPESVLCKFDVRHTGGNTTKGAKQDIEIDVIKQSKKKAVETLAVSLKTYWDTKSISLYEPNLSTFLAYLIKDKVKTSVNKKGSIVIDLIDFAKVFPEYGKAAKKELEPFLNAKNFRSGKESYSDWKKENEEAQIKAFAFIVKFLQKEYNNNKKEFNRGFLDQIQIDNLALRSYWSLTNKKNFNTRVMSSVATPGFRELVEALSGDFDMTFQQGDGLTLKTQFYFQGKKIAELNSHLNRKAIQHFMKIEFEI